MAKEILKLCMGKGFLLDKEMLDLFSSLTDEGVKNVVDILGNLGIEERVITKNLFMSHFDKFRNFLIRENGEDEIKNLFSGLGYDKKGEFSGEDCEKTEKLESGNLKIISAPAFAQKKYVLKDFVNHFRSRYKQISKSLEKSKFNDLSSIRKLGNERTSCTIIVSIFSKKTTKNGNLLVEVEDLTGNSIVLINKNKTDVFDKAKELLVDEVVAFKVNGTKEILFANDLIFPGTSLSEKRTCEIDEYVAFASDVHVGSKGFLENNFKKFINWLNGNEGDETQKKLSKKVKYLLFTGDSVDGVGVFPGQDKELEIKDMRSQYMKFHSIIKNIRKDIKIIICPGQHDAVWVGEPQPIIGEAYAPGLYEMENVTLVPNPATIEIDGGFKILMYHGASMHGIIEEIPEIRLNYGHDSPTRVVKEMLKRRHLSPMHGFCDYIPCETDPMVIDPIPDIITTGDQHRSEISMHENILLIASSCWQSKTAFEEKVGNNPDPCKVPLFNLKTREIKVLDFSDEKEIEEKKVDEEIGMAKKLGEGK